MAQKIATACFDRSLRPRRITMDPGLRRGDGERGASGRRCNSAPPQPRRSLRSGRYRKHPTAAAPKSMKRRPARHIPLNRVTPAEAGVHHEPMGKLEHGAEDRDRLLRPKPPSPRITMDPGFRRSNGRERATKAATPSLWRAGYPRNTPQLIGSGVRERGGRNSFAALPTTAFPAQAGTQGPGVAHLLHGTTQRHTLDPRMRGGSGEWRSGGFNFIRSFRRKPESSRWFRSAT
jgi:hypothetical protein